MATETYEKLPDGFRISIADSGSGGLGGGKGAKGSQQSVQEDANTIRSKAYVKLLCALSEGKIHAFGDEDPLKSIYLDETPIKNQDGTLNFKDVLIDFREGTQDQSYIPGVASSVEREQNVSVQLKQVNGAVTRTISDPNLDAVRLRFMFPAMRSISEDSLKISGTSVTFSIQLQSAGGRFVEVMRPTVTEKSTSPFELSNFHIPLTGQAPWNLRVERITPDSTSDKLQNELYWQGFTEIVDAKLRYPNTALLFIQIDAEQFSSIPKLAVKLYGIQCLIPHNYDPFNRVYNGMFNGSLVPGWTNNPAWILYDLITNKRYGLGDRINRSLINSANFYSVAQYCDELVPDGFGGYEPRFRLNQYITTQEDAIKLLEDICSVFRSMPYSYGGSIELSQDKPKGVTKIFSPANVICEDESGNPLPPFVYSSSALETRHTTAYVSWNNPDLFYKDDQVFYENAEAVQRYGFNQIDAKGVGITSRGQAYRYAKWLVEVAQNIKNTVTFKVGSEGDLIKVGEIFTVSDPLKMQKRYYGRITEGSTNALLNLSEELSLVKSNSYKITLWNPITNVAEQTNIQLPQTQAKTIGVSPALSFVPPKDTVYLVESIDLKPKPFQLISIVENGHEFELTGIDYYEALYNSIDLDTDFKEPTGYTGFADVRAPVKPPTNLTISESLYQSVGSAGVKVRIDVSWTPSVSPWVTKYEFEYKKSSDVAYRKVVLESTASYTIDDVEPTTYQFRVTAVNGLGAKSSALVSNRNILGLTKAPADVDNLQVSFYENYLTLTWNPSQDLDVRVGGYFKIKYTKKQSNITWSDGVEIATVAGINSSAQIPLLDGTFLIKAIDSSGNYSSNPAIILTKNLPQINTYFPHIAIDESEFAGDKSNLVLVGGQLKLATSNLFDSGKGLFDDTPGLFDNGGNVTSALTFPDSGLSIDDTSVLSTDPDGYLTTDSQLFTQSNNISVVGQGFYTFVNAVDLGGQATVRIVSNLNAISFSENSRFDDTPGSFDSKKGLFDGIDNNFASAQLQISVSQDGITYGGWQDFIIGDYLGRSFRFRLMLNSVDTNSNISIQQLGVEFFLPERIEARTVQTIASATTNIKFENAYLRKPEVSITILNAQPNDRIASFAVTNDGFSLIVLDVNNVIVQRSLSYFAQGFGRQLW